MDERAKFARREEGGEEVVKAEQRFGGHGRTRVSKSLTLQRQGRSRSG